MRPHLTITVISILDYKNLRYGSIEDYIIELSRYFRSTGIKHVVALREPLSDCFRAVLESHQVEIRLLTTARGKYFYIWLAKIIRDSKPEVVHFHFFPYVSMIAWFTYLMGVRKIVFTDHMSFSYPSGRLTRLVRFCKARILTAKIYRVIAVSNFVLNRIVHALGIPSRKAVLLYNCINFKRFRNARPGVVTKEFGIASCDKVIVTICWLIKEKGVRYLIEAARVIASRGLNIKLVIVGDGPEKGALQQLSRDLDLDDRVIFTGFRNDVESFLARADVFALHSLWSEAFGLVLLESMAAGTPVVATNTGAIPEIVHEGITGLLVEPGDVNGLAASLQTILEDTELRQEMGKNALEFAKGFNLEAYVKSVTEIYGLSD